MGRGKLKLELIPSEKQRKRAFEKTTKVLMNKCHEFSRRKLDVCMIIINGGGDPSQQQQQHTYPKQTEEVDRIIQRYLTTTKDKPPKKITGLSEIFSMVEQKKNIDSSELSKLYNIADNELIIDQYCPNGDSNELFRFIDLLDGKIKQVEQIIHAKKQQNYQQLDDDHDQVHGHDDHHVNHDHGLNFDHLGPHSPIDIPNLNNNNVQFVPNPDYQNLCASEPLSSNYNYSGQYHQSDQGYYNDNHISGTGPVVEDPTVVGMLEEGCRMFVNNNNNNNNNGDYPSCTSSFMMMPRQYYPDQLQSQLPVMIMRPPYQYTSMPLQLPEISSDRHHQQQMHGYDYSDLKGKEIDDEYIHNEFLFA